MKINTLVRYVSSSQRLSICQKVPINTYMVLKHIHHFKHTNVYMCLTLQDVYLGGWPDAQDVLVTGEKELPEMTVFCGSCGWGAYQLETEEKMGSWVVVSASAKCMEEILRGENLRTSSALLHLNVWLAFESSLAIWSLLSSAKKQGAKLNICLFFLFRACKCDGLKKSVR